MWTARKQATINFNCDKLNTHKWQRLNDVGGQAGQNIDIFLT